MKYRALFAAAVLSLWASGAGAGAFSPYDVQLIDSVEGTVYGDTYDPTGKLIEHAIFPG